MRIVTEHNFSSQDIADMFVGMIECNDMTTQWCRGIYPVNNADESLPDKKLVWYAQKEYFANPEWVVKVHFDKTGEEEGNGLDAELVDEATFRQGLQTMAYDHPTHFNDLVSDDGGNADAITYDVLLQLIVLGEVVYG